MAKFALCIKRSEAPQAVLDAFAGDKAVLVPIEASFWQTETFLADRAVCETDETTLQLLPYIKVGVERGDTFRYTRGGGGEEARLHGNYSVGVGGHVDVKPGPGYLLTVIQEEAAREGKEETKLTLALDKLTPTHFICDPTNAVGRVHLGLLISYKLPEDVSMDFEDDMEDGMIENACLCPTAVLMEPEVFARLENWSKVVVADMAADESLKEKAYNEEMGAKESMAADDESDSDEDDEGAGDTSYDL
jgi:predicted NUDIX family phosphoesterase